MVDGPVFSPSGPASPDGASSGAGSADSSVPRALSPQLVGPEVGPPSEGDGPLMRAYYKAVIARLRAQKVRGSLRLAS